MTITEILRMFRELADDLATSNPLWSDATLLQYLDEAQLEAVRRTRMLDDRETPEICTIPVIANTTTYDVDPRVLFIRRVKASWADRPLAKTYSQWLDNHEPGWESAAAVPEPRWWTPWNSHRLRIEKPSANGTITLWVIRDPLARPHTHSPDPISVTSITRVGNVATVVLSAAPTYPIVVGDHALIAGADDVKYNGSQHITSVINTTSFTYHVSGNPPTPATGTITATFEASPLELPARYHHKLVDWMLYRALLQRDKEEKYDPKSAKDHLDLFEQEFGPRSSAIDETWIRRNHGYDDNEGLY